MKGFGSLLLLLAAPVLAEAADDGREIYLEACAGCHGASGAGDGTNTDLVGVPVPDLSGLAIRNGGSFDSARVIYLIDGRAGLSAHGGPMPMYGGLLTGPAAVVDGPDGSPVVTTKPILAVVEWLESIQKEE